MGLKEVVLASALALGGATVQAATHDFGVHDPLEISLSFLGAGYVSPGSFFDFYQFELPTGNTVNSTVVANNNGSILHVSDGFYAVLSVGSNGVFEQGGGDDVLGPVFSFDGTTGSTTNPVVLPAGKFYYAVVGTADGSSGGSYLLTSTIPVPEPETNALILAGLGVIGWVIKRRKLS